MVTGQRSGMIVVIKQRNREKRRHQTDSDTSGYLIVGFNKSHWRRYRRSKILPMCRVRDVFYCVLYYC